MLHNIAPHQFHNEYRDISPESEDLIISVNEGNILIKDTDGEIIFPMYKDIPEKYKENAGFIYLFAIDRTNFFLCRNLIMEGFIERDPRTLRRNAAPQHLIYAALAGSQLARWYDNSRYCGHCGTALVQDRKERMLFCPECGLMVYPRINPCVIVGVIHDGKILVSQYKNGFKDHYALTAGFAEIGETIEETAAREVYEETHQHIKNLRFYKSQPWPYSDSLLFGFFADLDASGDIIIQEDELAMAKWVSPREIYEIPDNFSLTNEMLCRFRDDFGSSASTGEDTK